MKEILNGDTVYISESLQYLRASMNKLVGHLVYCTID